MIGYVIDKLYIFDNFVQAEGLVMGQMEITRYPAMALPSCEMLKEVNFRFRNILKLNIFNCNRKK